MPPLFTYHWKLINSAESAIKEQKLLFSETNKTQQTNKKEMQNPIQPINSCHYSRLAKQKANKKKLVIVDLSVTLRVSHVAAVIKDSSVDLVITTAGMKPHKQATDHWLSLCFVFIHTKFGHPSQLLVTETKSRITCCWLNLILLHKQIKKRS